MTTLKSFKIQDNLIEQVYYGNQDIRYKVNGVEYDHDKFWSAFEPIKSEVIKKLNG